MGCYLGDAGDPTPRHARKLGKTGAVAGHQLRREHAEHEQRCDETDDEDETSRDIEQTETRLFGEHVRMNPRKKNVGYDEHPILPDRIRACGQREHGVVGARVFRPACRKVSDRRPEGHVGRAAAAGGIATRARQNADL